MDYLLIDGQPFPPAGANFRFRQSSIGALVRVKIRKPGKHQQSMRARRRRRVVGWVWREG